VTRFLVAVTVAALASAATAASADTETYIRRCHFVGSSGPNPVGVTVCLPSEVGGGA
jgi:hypothetical protein